MSQTYEKEIVDKWTQEEETTKEKNMKWNYVELCGRLTKLPHTTDKATFLSLGVFQERAKEGEKEYPTFVDVAIFNQKLRTLVAEASLATPFEIKARLSNIKNKEGHTLLSLIATDIKKFIPKKDTEKVEEETKDIPWEEEENNG